MDWEMVLKIKGGHRYFKDVATGRIAVADNSGTSPEYTEDGILWLDGERDMTICNGLGSVSIPVVNPSGVDLWTGESFFDALLVAEKFGMKVTGRNDGKKYEITAVEIPS